MSNELATQLAADRERLAYEVARNRVGAQLPVRDLLYQIGVTEAEFLAASRDALFKRSVKAYVKELEEDGTSFRLKARVAAEDSIPVAYSIIHNGKEPGSTRMKALNDLVRWAGLESQAQQDGFQVPTFQINFNLGESASQPPARVARVVQGETVDESEE